MFNVCEKLKLKKIYINKKKVIKNIQHKNKI